ncbi:iron chaperone [Micromonospora rifamycinica]|uniref:iron chaperone n=1 Tax=Micromonospora rifamycinica TaxID=291594 RepID=UPI003F5413FE
MSSRSSTTASGDDSAEGSDGASGFSVEERAAMQERAAELRAEGRKGAKKADGMQAVLDRIAQMAPADRVLAERVHLTVTAVAPELSPKTWYGMPAYANADGKIVIFFQDAGKFTYRYSTLGFQEAANLDDGDLWPVSYALRAWSPEVEKQVRELVAAAVS